MSEFFLFFGSLFANAPIQEEPEKIPDKVEENEKPKLKDLEKLESKKLKDKEKQKRGEK